MNKSILSVLLTLTTPSLLMAMEDNPDSFSSEEEHPPQRSVLFGQIKNNLDLAYTLAVEVANEEMSDTQRHAHDETAAMHLEDAWQDIDEFNGACAEGQAKIPFSRMELKIDTHAEALKTKTMFVLLMTVLANFQVDHL